MGTLYAFESDPAWQALAMVKPRTDVAFHAVWAGLFIAWAAARARGQGLETTGVLQWSILVNGILCGAIGCRLLSAGGKVVPMGMGAGVGVGVGEPAPRWTIGYGLGRAHWGKGIASEALALVLPEVRRMLPGAGAGAGGAGVGARAGAGAAVPLYATAAASNAASIRVLEKHGFTIHERRSAPESEWCLAREEVTLRLGA